MGLEIKDRLKGKGKEGTEKGRKGIEITGMRRIIAWKGRDGKTRIDFIGYKDRLYQDTNYKDRINKDRTYKDLQG